MFSIVDSQEQTTIFDVMVFQVSSWTYLSPGQWHLSLLHGRSSSLETLTTSFKFYALECPEPYRFSDNPVTFSPPPPLPFTFCFPQDYLNVLLHFLSLVSRSNKNLSHFSGCLASSSNQVPVTAFMQNKITFFATMP